jgi:UPF0755 protein
MLGITMLALVVASFGYIILREIRTPVGGMIQPVEIVIDNGDSTNQIATKLRAARLIRQPVLFTALVRYSHLEDKLQSGTYTLNTGMTMSQIATALQFSETVAEIEVTIPEGLRIEEVAEIFASKGLAQEQEFLDIARQGAQFRAEYDVLKSLPIDASLEGYLFPDTYRFAETATVTDIIEIMLDHFDSQYMLIENEVAVPDVSIHEIVTMASVVQREAMFMDEMPKIAAVFWNRLKPENFDETGNGRLQADPTVQYALGYSNFEQTWWRKELTATDLKIDNPYNTREYPGLPPGPIANPGLAALRAAANPDNEANYLYFVVSCKGDGSHNFATNFVDFQQFEAEYLGCSGN